MYTGSPARCFVPINRDIKARRVTKDVPSSINAALSLKYPILLFVEQDKGAEPSRALLDLANETQKFSTIEQL